MGLTIVLVEDNGDWSDSANLAIPRAFPACEVRSIYSESEFRAALPSFLANPPSVFVIDNMLPWAEPAPDMPEPPDDVKSNGFFRAGMRCRHWLGQYPALNGIPVIFWTIIAKEDLERDYKDLKLPEFTWHASKTEGTESLIQTIRQVTASASS